MQKSVPLSNFKLFPFATCGKGNTFEECQTTMSGRKVPRKVLQNGEISVRMHVRWFLTVHSRTTRRRRRTWLLRVEFGK